MATAQDFITELAAKVAAMGGLTPYERLLTDYGLTARPSSYDIVGFKIRVNHVEQDATANANVTYTGIQCELEMVGGRARWEDEREYTEGVALTDQATLIDRSREGFWLSMASVHSFWGVLQVAEEMERVGKFYPYTVVADIALQP